MEGNEKSVFERSEKLIRSPPSRARTMSVPNMTESVETIIDMFPNVENSAKRKRTDISTKQLTQEKTENVTEIGRILSVVNHLKTLCRPNTAMGIVRDVETLEKLVIELQYKAMDRVDIACQCNLQPTIIDPDVKATAEIVSKIKNIEVEEDIAQLLSMNWPQIAYKNSEIAIGNPFTGKTKDIAIILKDITDNTKGLFKMILERYPELADDNNLDEDKINHICCSTTVMNKDHAAINRHILKKTLEDSELSSVVNSIKILCNRLISLNINSVAVPIISGMETEQMRKIVEISTYGIDIKVCIHVPKIFNQEASKNNIPDTINKIYKTDAIVLKQEGVSYKDMLLGVKDVISKLNEDADIQSVRKTKEGNLLLTLKKDNPQNTTLLRAINRQMPTANARLHNDQKLEATLHIKSLDATTSIDDIQQGLSKILGSNDQDPVSVSNLRPGYAETQIATIKTTKKQAAKLLELKRVKIGIGSPLIEERINLRSCHKCWNYDHETAKCPNEDISKNCRNCCKSGHIARNCTEIAECPICKEVGHRAGSSSCPKFKHAMKEGRRRIGLASDMLD